MDTKKLLLWLYYVPLKGMKFRFHVFYAKGKRREESKIKYLFLCCVTAN